MWWIVDIKYILFDVNKFLKANEGIRTGLSDRVIYNSGADGNDQLIRMQSLDKYRGDGAGNVGGEFTPAQLEVFSALKVLEEVFENDRAGLESAIQKFSNEDLAAYRKYKRGQQ